MASSLGDVRSGVTTTSWKGMLCLQLWRCEERERLPAAQAGFIRQEAAPVAEPAALPAKAHKRSAQH